MYSYIRFHYQRNDLGVTVTYIVLHSQQKYSTIFTNFLYTFKFAELNIKSELLTLYKCLLVFKNVLSKVTNKLICEERLFKNKYLFF